MFVFLLLAEIAQWLERRIENPEVVRSNRIFGKKVLYAPVMELVDMIDLGSIGFFSFAGSNLARCIKFITILMRL